MCIIQTYSHHGTGAPPLTLLVEAVEHPDSYCTNSFSSSSTWSTSVPCTSFSLNMIEVHII